MAVFTVVICESDGQWAAGLRRELQPERVRLRETRRLIDCQRELEEADAGLVLIEWSAARRAELADFVDRISRRFPRTCIVVLAQRNAAGDERIAREAGAIHFTSSPRALGPVVRLIRRQRDRAATAEDDSSRQFLESLAGNSEIEGF
jgi:DNA-binding response OmpR family regulator